MVYFFHNKNKNICQEAVWKYYDWANIVKGLKIMSPRRASKWMKKNGYDIIPLNSQLRYEIQKKSDSSSPLTV